MVILPEGAKGAYTLLMLASNNSYKLSFDFGERSEGCVICSVLPLDHVQLGGKASGAQRSVVRLDSLWKIWRKCKWLGLGVRLFATR